MEIDAPNPPAAFSSLRRVKGPAAFPFKLNLVLKTVAAFFWDKACLVIYLVQTRLQLYSYRFQRIC